jgi:hypothetical protein
LVKAALEFKVVAAAVVIVHPELRLVDHWQWSMLMGKTLREQLIDQAIRRFLSFSNHLSTQMMIAAFWTSSFSYFI